MLLKKLSVAQNLMRLNCCKVKSFDGKKKCQLEQKRA